MVARGGDQLVVTKLDRLGRSLEHLITLSNGLQERSVDLVVLDQGIDTATAVGRMFFQILGAIAEFEHALMSERTMDGLAAARARGRPAGRNPSSLPARPVSLRRCTTRPTGRANAATPWRRSPPSSASPGQPSTVTWRRRKRSGRAAIAPVPYRDPMTAPRWEADERTPLEWRLRDLGELAERALWKAGERRRCRLPPDDRLTVR